MIPIKIPMTFCLTELDKFVLKVKGNSKYGRLKKHWIEEWGLGYKIIKHTTKQLQLKQYDIGTWIER